MRSPPLVIVAPVRPLLFVIFPLLLNSCHSLQSNGTIANVTTSSEDAGRLNSSNSSGEAFTSSELVQLKDADSDAKQSQQQQQQDNQPKKSAAAMFLQIVMIVLVVGLFLLCAMDMAVYAFARYVKTRRTSATQTHVEDIGVC